MKKTHLALAATASSLLAAALPAIERATPAGVEPDGDSFGSAISENGRFLFTESQAGNFVSGDSNSSYDIFRFDRKTGAVIRVSTDGTGTQLPSDSGTPACSNDGNLVAFETAANIDPNDMNSNFDVYLKNIATGAIQQISVSTNGDRGNDQSKKADISADGNRIVFESNANNLDTGDTGLDSDIFLRDVSAGTTIRISKAVGGGETNSNSFNPSISADGKFVVFESDASDLVANDRNGTTDIFLYTVASGNLQRVSVIPGGAEANFSSTSPDISGDGNIIVFHSDASNLDPNDNSTLNSIYLYNRSANTLEVLTDSMGNGIQAAVDPVISQTGKFIAFSCNSSSVVPNDTEGKRDIFVYDRTADSYRRISETAAGVGTNEAAYRPAISGHGNVISFYSLANNLVGSDTNGAIDVFHSENSFVTCRPDLRIGTKRSLSSHKGNNIYNGNGSGQTAKLKLRGKKKGKAYFTGENDGNIPAELNLRLPKAPKSKKFKYKFFRLTGGKMNIKAAVKRAGYVSNPVDPGAAISYSFECKAKRKNGRKKKARYVGKPILTTTCDPAEKTDVVKLKVIAKP